MKPGLQSRRQQSEPPNNRNVFPPTPPPENDKPQMSRGTSVRAGPKPVPSKLNLDRARPNERYDKASPDDGQRPRPSRAASAQPTRGYSQREAPRRQRSVEEDEDAYPDLYDMYQGGGNTRTSRQKSTRGGSSRYIEEEEEGSDYDDASFDEGDFEMVSGRRGPASVSGASRRSTSKRVVPTKVRIKVHAGDVRYIMVGMAIEFPDLVSSIQAKFGLRRRFKIKVRDDDSSDGDMVTMGDQDDLDMIMSSVGDQAKRQRLDTGKLEVS